MKLNTTVYYIASLVDETPDCATLSQLAFIMQYELKGKGNERFISFIQSKDHTAEELSDATFF